MNLIKKKSTLFPFIFDEFFKNNWDINISQNSYSPFFNTKENDKEFVLELIVPGKNNEDFKIEIDKRLLSVSSTIVEEKSKHNYILYAHDDFYFSPGWDEVLKKEVDEIGHNNFYLSGTMMHNGQINFNCGDTLENFDENKFIKNFKNYNYFYFQGSTWAPHLIHKTMWDKVGGFSEEFYPGTGSDPDLNMKLWKCGVRIFKGINNFKVYHFGSIVTRKYKDHPNLVTETGSRGGKIFLLKWGFSIKFFKKFIMQSDTKYLGKLNNPEKNINYLTNILMNKLYYFYIKYIYNHNNRHELIKK